MKITQDVPKSPLKVFSNYAPSCCVAIVKYMIRDHASCCPLIKFGDGIIGIRKACVVELLRQPVDGRNQGTVSPVGIPGTAHNVLHAPELVGIFNVVTN